MYRGWFLGGCLMLGLMGAAKESAPHAPLPMKEQESILAKMRETLASVKTVKFTLKQRRVLKVFEDELNSEGLLYFQVPDHIRWEISKPYRSLIIFQKKQAAKFEYRVDHWQKLDFGAADILSEMMSNVAAWTRGEFSNNALEYDVSVYPGFVIRLQPKSEKLRRSLEAIEMYIDPKNFRARRVVLREVKGDFVEITFEQPQENIPLAEKLFDLEKPI